MNAKTYGQVLLDEMYEGIHFERLSMVPEEEFDRCARAVILEFVKRVEERAEGIANACKVDPRFDSSLDAAFCELSTELKEAK